MDNINYDKINIKTLAEIFTKYFHKNNVKKYNNLRKFYSRLLELVSDEMRDSYLNRILKYLSSISSSTITIFDDFNNGIYDKELLRFAKLLFEEISNCENYELFFKDLYESINYPFFLEEEYSNLVELYESKDYVNFILFLLKHAIRNYKISTPSIIAQRIFDESMTFKYNSEYQRRMIKESALLGNSQAMQLYANFIYYDNIELAVNLFLKNKNTMSAIWELGFILENDNASYSSIKLIKKELHDILEEDDFIDKIIVSDDCNKDTMKLAFQLYYYITKNSNFSKAYNSVGKLLLTHKVSYNNNDDETLNIAINFLNKAVSLGNINSMYYLSMYKLNNLDKNLYNYKFIIMMLKKSADLGDPDANYEYGKILKKENNDEAEKYLIYATERDNVEACLELAKYYEFKNEYDKAIKYYKECINKNKYEAVYDLCLLYAELKDSYDNYTYLYKAQQLFNDYREKLDKEFIEKLNKIL